MPTELGGHRRARGGDRIPKGAEGEGQPGVKDNSSTEDPCLVDLLFYTILYYVFIGFIDTLKGSLEES